MIVLTARVTQACPSLTRELGCSLTVPFGLSHTTDGNVPFFTSFSNAFIGLMLDRWGLSCTVTKLASGFQMFDVRAFCLPGVQMTGPVISSQSGSVPAKT